MTDTSKLFTQLSTAIEAADYEEAIDVARNILKVTPDDKDALRCLSVAQLHSGDHEAAAKTMFGDKLLGVESLRADDEDLYERAYCLYRLQRIDDATRYLDAYVKSGGADASAEARVLALRAQLQYNAEQYKDAAANFERLASTGSGGSTTPSGGAPALDEDEVYTNWLAALSMSDALHERGARLVKERADTSMKRTHEFVYNAATLAIASGDLSRAEQLLRDAESLCRRTMSDDGYDATEIDAEIGQVRVQLAYVLQRTQRSAEAARLYADFLKTASPSSATMAVAANNDVCARGAHDFDALKKLRHAMQETVAVKLTGAQRRAIDFNLATCLYHMNKFGECEQELQRLEGQYPDTAHLCTLLRAAILRKRKQHDEAAALLTKYVAEHDKTIGADRCRIMLAQFALQRGELADCEAQLRACTQLSARAAVKGALVQLLEEQGRGDDAMKLLDEYIGGVGQSANVAALRQSGKFQLNHGHYKEAAELLERVVKENRRDLEALPLLIIALSHVDPSRASEIAERLPPVFDEAKLAAMNADALLSAATGIKLSKSSAQLSGSDAAGADGDSSTPNARAEEKERERAAAEAAFDVEAERLKKRRERRRAKRKPRYPKGFDPEHPEQTPKPDPERWIKKRDRAAFRKKFKKKLGTRGGHQGAVESEASEAQVKKQQQQRAMSANQAKPKAPKRKGRFK